MSLVNNVSIGDTIANAVNGINPMSPANLAILKSYWEPIAAGILASGAGGFTSYNIVSANLAHGVQGSVSHGMSAAPTLALVLGADGGKSVRGSPVLADLGSGNVGVTLDYDLAATVLTDWTSFVPTGVWVGPNATYTGMRRRVGDSLECQVRISLSGAPSGSLTIDLPSGLVIDTAKLVDNTDGRSNLGAGDASIAGGASGANTLVVSYNTTTAVKVRYLVTTASAGIVNGFITPTMPATFAAGDFINFWYRVPIVGWTTGPDAAVSANVTLMLLKQ